MVKLVLATIGEALLVLRAPHGETLESAHTLNVLLGGAECNVAIGYSRLGLPAYWIGRMCNDPIGRNLIRRLRADGVATDGVIWTCKGRTGIMYTEMGMHPRPNRSFYDRLNSAGAYLKKEELPLSVLDRCHHLHLSGITPATGPEAHETILFAAQYCKAAGHTVSYDLNYRAKLWPPQESREFLRLIADKIDILKLSRVEAQEVLGFEGPEVDVIQGIQDKFAVATVVLTSKDKAFAIDHGNVTSAPKVQANQINRFGAGDAFMAGFLAAFLTFYPRDAQQALWYGQAASALKVTHRGANSPMYTREEIEALITYCQKNGATNCLGASSQVER